MNALKNAVAIALALVFIPAAFATERGHSATVKAVYPSANGTFAVAFANDSSYCLNASSPRKYYYVAIGQNGVTADGHKLIYSTVLSALLTNQVVAFAFDDATSNCYINRVLLEVP